jgi:hypothetical protein
MEPRTVMLDVIFTTPREASGQSQYSTLNLPKNFKVGDVALCTFAFMYVYKM